MPYNSRTLTSLIAEISSAMNDSTNVHFTLNEVKYAVWEALRYFSACACYWVDRGNFTIKSPFASPNSLEYPAYWYHLPTELPTLRPQTCTFDHICREIQLHLYEPESGVSGTGQIQFDPITVLQSVIRARNRFALEAGVPMAIGSLAVSAGDGYVALPQNIAKLYRLVWADNNPGQPSIRTRLELSDPLTTSCFLTTSQSSYNQLPRVYSHAETNPLSIQLNPPPSNPGTIEYTHSYTVNFLSDLIVNTDTLQIPDDFAPAVKYAAMSDLLTTDSERTNPLLAKYCDLRYTALVEQAKLQRCVIAARINNQSITLCTPTQLDLTQPYWMNRAATSRPYFAATLYDLAAFAPFPTSSQTYSATLDLVRSAPIPVNGSDYVQLPLDLIPSIIDYAQHYLSLKLGGADFTQTFHAFNSFQSMMERNMQIKGARIRPITEVLLASSMDQAYTPISTNTSVNFPNLQED